MEKKNFYDTSTLGFSHPKMTLNKKKIESFDKLRRIVEDVKKAKTEETEGEVPTKVIDMIKAKIQDNYETLYSNYEENKKEILENIQQTENNQAGENALQSKAEIVVKEKHQYDKLYDEIKKKEAKLKKMIDFRNQARENSLVNEQELKVLQERIKLSDQLEEKKKKVDYEASMLLNMRNERKKVLFFLKDKYQNQSQEEKTKSQKLKKLVDRFHVKRNVLSKIEETGKQNDSIELPKKLKEQLSLKFEEFENQQKNLNILKHESKLMKKFMKQKMQERCQREKIVEEISSRREEAEKENYKIIQNELEQKKMVEQKIKNTCGVQMLSQVVNQTFTTDFFNLKNIQKAVKDKVDGVKSSILKIHQEIDNILIEANEIKCFDVNKKEENLQRQRNQLRKMKNQTATKLRRLKDWNQCLQYFIGGKYGRLELIIKLKNDLPKYKQQFEKNKKVFTTKENLGFESAN